MIQYPDEKVAATCRLGPVQAAALLERGRGGDLSALADWTVYAAYRAMIRRGATPAAALLHTRTLLKNVRLNPSVST